MKIDKNKFVFLNTDETIIKDVAFETKEIGYYKDAWNRFKKNKTSLVAFVIICIIFFFVIFGPYLKSYTPPSNLAHGAKLGNLPPKIPFIEKLGIFNGHKKVTRDKKFLVELYNSDFGKDVIIKGMPEVLIDDDPSNDYLYEDTSITVVLDMYKYQNIIASHLSELGDQTRLIEIMTDKEFEIALERNIILEIVKVNSDGTVYNVRVDFFLYILDQTPEDTYFWFGTDRDGKDLFTVLWNGARISIMMALVIVIINSIIGITLGSLAGYYGGKFDLFFDRFVDILGGIPFMAVLTLLILRFGTTLGIIIVAFTLTGWIGSYSMARMQFYRFKNREYVLVAKTLGASDPRIMFKHIFPNAIGYMVTSFSLAIPAFVFTESTYSFLGIINYTSVTSVGLLLDQGQQVMQIHPHLVLFPALYISVLMITFNLFGNGLRDAFNPSLRGAE